LTAFGQLEATFVDAPLDMFFRITSAAKPSRLDLLGGRRQEDHPGLRHHVDHLTGTGELDLEQHVASCGRRGDRSAIEMTEELGPLQEATSLDVRLETWPVDKNISILVLAWARRSSRPTP
jgi:hypothetical protein